jgi:murein DD-endopeptidase MepM/ murein hydrolase activator NlpD
VQQDSRLEIAEVAEAQPIPEELQTVVVERSIGRDSTLNEILSDYGFTPPDVHRLIEDTRPVYNLNRIKAGNILAIETLEDGTFQSLRYQISIDQYLLASANDSGFSASLHRHEFELEVDELSGVISDSLYATLKAIGEKDQLIANMAEILQWDIDFTVIQSGDWFRVVVEKYFLQGELIKYGNIHAVQFHTGDKDFYGFRFDNPGTGKAKYFDEKGKALRKAFLKVPFSFSPRISSGFSYSRFHPILKRRRAHPAVDFAAPRGTPVLASGNGRVVYAGWKGGLGKFVQIKHPNGYTTGYAHLSRILVKSGQAVQQSQRIGRVGSTGLANGAHLDYRIQDKRGKYLNPRKKISWPSDKPVEKKYWSEFAAVRDTFLEQLDAIPAGDMAQNLIYRAD